LFSILPKFSPIFLLLLTVAFGQAWGFEESSTTDASLPTGASSKSLEPSKSCVSGKMMLHHPENPVELPRTTGPIITDEAVTQPYKTWSAQLTPTLSFVGGDFSSSWRRLAVGANQPTQEQQIAARGDYKTLQIPIQLSYGLTSRTEVNFYIPFVQNWASDVGPAGQAANFGSLGDSSLTVKYMFLKGGPTDTTATGYVSVQFPSGHASPLSFKLLGIDQTGSGAYALTWGLDIFRYVPPFLLYGNIFYTNYSAATVDGARTYYLDKITGNFALELPFKNSPTNNWVFLLEMLSTWDAGRLIGHQANQSPQALVSILPALEFLPTNWFQMALGVQVPLFGKNTQYTYTPTLSCWFSF
jgi:hypothetical protein